MVQTGTRTPDDWLASAEKLWRPRLESAGLAVEVLAEAPLASKAAKAFGMLYQHDPSRGYRTLQKHPAAVVTAFTGVATRVYEGGTFWPGFWDTCGYQASPSEQVEWGDAFLRGLGILGLPTFPGLPKRVLGPLLLHTGIPTYCLNDYFHVLEVGMRRVGADADALVQWAIPRLDTTFPNVDIPVRRFLQYGGEYAVDFVDQSLDALLVLTEDSDAVVNSMIPERVVDAARDFLAADRARARSIKQRGGQSKPRLNVVLDPYAGELQLRLPALDSFDDDLTWVITADGDTTKIRPLTATAGWSVSVLESSWRISRPVRSISVTAAGLDDSLDIRLVHDQDPVLFFQEGGESLPSHMALPPESVWVLYALPETLDEPEFAPHILRTELPPLGWTGWSLALVDLTDQASVRLSPSHPTHAIRTQSRAVLTTDGEIGWVTMHGLPVHNCRPTLHLPDNISANWRLRVTDLDSSSVLVDKQVQSHEEFHDALDPFAGVADPIVGRFEISVKGPFGRGVSRSLAVAEGLSFSPAQPWRSLTLAGLEPVVVEIAGQALTCSPGSLSFEANDSSLPATVVSDGRTAELTVSPPAMAVATLRSGIASRWSFGLVRIHLEEVAEYQLLVRIQPHTQAGELHVQVGGTVVQRVSPESKSGSGYANYALDVITDTARAHSGCDLFILAGGVSTRVARIEPKRIASGVQVADSTVSLIDFTGGGVEVRVWSVLSPWLDPACGPVNGDGVFNLPDHLQAQGPLAVSWQRFDPWIPNEWPWRPRTGDCSVVHVGTSTERCSDAALYLAGEVQAAPDLALPEAWSLLAMASRLTQEYSWARVHALTSALREDTAAAMRALLALPATPADRLNLLIRSGVLWARCEAMEDSVDLLTDASNLLRTEQLVGPLLVLPSLVQITDNSAGAECWRALREVYGEEMISIVFGNGDPAYKGGSFAIARWLDEQEIDVQERIIAQLRLVPRALLDVESRTAAALELFQKRDQGNLVKVGRDGRERLKLQADILRERHWESALKLLESRADAEGRGGWPSLSAQSAGFALVARLAARGDEFAIKHLETEFGHWLALAESAPRIVSADLVLAEAMATAEFSAAPTSNPFAEMPDESDAE